MNTNKSGRKWARAGLTIGMGLSIGGNFVHSLLAESVITPWLRAWPAIFLPVIAFVSIEILIRIEWERKASWQLARLLIIAPLIGAGVSSFEHLRSLLLIMGERDFTAWWIPGAIDGLIIGATVVLIVTRPRSLSLEASAREMTDEELERIVEKWTETPAPLSENPPAISDEEMESLVEKWRDVLFPEGTEKDWGRWEGARAFSEDAVEAFREDAESESAEIPLRRVDTIILEPSPASVPILPGVSSRASTSSLAQGMAAVELLLTGRKPTDVATETGAGQSTVYRWRKVLNTLSHDANAIVNGVNADLVEYMRERVH